MWAHPDLLPGPADLDDPSGFVSGSTISDDDLAALASGELPAGPAPTSDAGASEGPESAGPGAADESPTSQELERPGLERPDPNAGPGRRGPGRRGPPAGVKEPADSPGESPSRDGRRLSSD